MSTAPIAFTGLSTYSSDFQSILQREVSIAQLPLQRLQNSQANILSEKQALASLNTAVEAVGSSLQALGTAAANKGLTAASSNPSLVSVQSTGAPSAGQYIISNVTSIATAASETSVNGFADSTTAPVSAQGTLSLTLGSKTYNINLTPDKNNLGGLRDAINALGVGVTASVLTTGTGATPDYLSIQANATGKTTLQLNDLSGGTPTNILTSNNQGSDASFQINGLNVNQPSNTVNGVVPGVTFTLLGTTAANQTATINLSSDRSPLTSALQNFATNYNALVDQVNGQVGSSAGPLSGDLIIRQVQADLNQTTSYYHSGSSSVKSLSDLGLTLDTTGKITFDPSVVNSFGDTQLSDAYSFLGSSTTGFGALAQNYTQLSDPISGLIKTESLGLDQSYQNLSDRITTVNNQVSTIQASWTTRLQTADAAVATLQSQQQLITASIQAVDYTLYGKDFGLATSGG